MSDRPFGPGIIPPGADVSSLWDSVASALASVRDRGGEAIGDVVEGIGDVGHRIRYGMDPTELRQRINAGSAPGATPNPGLGSEDREARRAAAYYFARQWPRLAPMVQGPVNALRNTRTIPGLTGIVPMPNPFADEGDEGQREELYRVANEASQRGVADAFDETQYASAEDE